MGVMGGDPPGRGGGQRITGWSTSASRWAAARVAPDALLRALGGDVRGRLHPAAGGDASGDRRGRDGGGHGILGAYIGGGGGELLL